MAVPRIFVICSGLAFLLMFVSYWQAFAGETAPSRPAVAQQARPAAITPTVPFTPAVAEQHPTPEVAAQLPVAKVAPSHRTATTGAVSASAPGKPVSSVAASAEHGRLAGSCMAYTDLKRQKLLQPLPAALPAANGGRPGCLEPTTMCEALRHAFNQHVPKAHHTSSAMKRRQLVVTAAGSAQVAMVQEFTQATAALRLPTLVLCMDETAYAAAKQTTAAAVLLAATTADASPSVLSRKWAALGEILEAGAGVFWADVDAVLAADPFPLLAADSDVEALSEGWEEIFLRGHVMGARAVAASALLPVPHLLSRSLTFARHRSPSLAGADDPSMGWSRYCESMRAAMLSPSLMYLEPTAPSRQLALLLAAQALQWPSAEGYAWGAGVEEATALSFELLMPAHDATSRVGAKLRVMHAEWYIID